MVDVAPSPLVYRAPSEKVPKKKGSTRLELPLVLARRAVDRGSRTRRGGAEGRAARGFAGCGGLGFVEGTQRQGIVAPKMLPAAAAVQAVAALRPSWPPNYAMNASVYSGYINAGYSGLATGKDAAAIARHG